MAKLALTHGQIIETGLGIAGRPDLTSEARLWLNLFLERFYYNQDVEWLVKTLADQALSDGMALPADYRAMKSMLIFGLEGTGVEPKVIYDAAEYNNARSSVSDDLSGIPSTVYIDLLNQTLNFLPAPSASLTIDLSYYHIPTIVDHEDDTFDDEVPTWEMPSAVLVDFIKAAAMEYNDDQRQFDIAKMVDMAIAGAKMNNRDSRAGHSRMKMGKSFRKRFR